MTDKELLMCVCRQLGYRYYDELNTKEQIIVDAMVEAGYLAIKEYSTMYGPKMEEIIKEKTNGTN